MPTPGHDEIPPITHLSISSLVRASTCLRKFFYQKVGLEGPSGPALQFGKAIHAAIPSLQSGSVEDALAIFDEVWGTDPDPDSDSYDRKRNRERARAMMEDFRESHRPGNAIYELIEPPAEVRPSGPDVSPWEVEFSVDIGLARPDGTPIPLEGRLDSLARHVETGEVFVPEYKTSGEVSGRYMNSLALTPQIIGYPSVLRQQGIECAGTIGEVLRVSPNRVETAVEPFRITPAQTEAFFAWARWYGQLILLAEGEGVWPQNLAACSPMPGHHQAGFTCEFAPLCHTTEDWRKVRSEFEREEGPPVTLTVKETDDGGRRNDPGEVG